MPHPATDASDAPEVDATAPDSGAVSQLVSVVVVTKDIIRTIEPCLRSIKEQTWPNVELLVVDNFSTDGTWQAAEQLADVAIQAGPERSAQRNLGAERAHGDWLLWVDADMELPSTIIERAMAQAQAENAVAVFVPEVTVGDGYWTACRALERSCCVEEVLVQSPRLIRRDYLLRSGGFLETLAGTEDAELRARMIADGCALAWIPDLIIHDEGRLSLSGILKKRYYYGRGLKQFRQRHPGALAGQAGAAVEAYRKNWRKLAAQPAIAAGVVLMRAGELAAYGLGAAVGAVEPLEAAPES